MLGLQVDRCTVDNFLNAIKDYAEEVKEEDTSEADTNVAYKRRKQCAQTIIGKTFIRTSGSRTKADDSLEDFGDIAKQVEEESLVSDEKTC